MYWYVVFVRTGREERVKTYLKEHWGSERYIPFVPLHEVLFRISGVTKKEVLPLFPGYVFVESEVSGHEFIKSISPLIRESNDIVNVLKYGENEFAMKESERQMLLSLSDDNYCIGSSYGVKEGSKIYITEGPLKGRESIVKKVDRRKMRALIEMALMGNIHFLYMGLEIANSAPEICYNI